MINKFLVRNYRIFNELNIETLSRINLFVGRNNSGKSCLLEAIHLYTSGGNAEVLSGIVSDREEDWNDTASAVNVVYRQLDQIDSPFKYLFHGYRFPSEADTEGAIEIGTTGDNSGRIKIMPRFYQVTRDKDGRIIRQPISGESIDQLVDIEVGLELSEGTESRFLTSIFNLRSAKMIKPVNGRPTVQLVPPRYIDNEIIEKLWDNINITDLEEEVIRCLQLIDPNVKKIAFVGGPQKPYGKKIRVPIVRYADSEQRIPLKSLGDGMTRLFHIILSLVNARNGYLLIDEFENGLHWSIQPGMWKIVFSLAEKLDVQVFATTHNRDCIRSFHEVWATRETEGAFYRMDLSPTSPVYKLKPVNYSSETLADALDTGVEVR